MPILYPICVFAVTWFATLLWAPSNVSPGNNYPRLTLNPRRRNDGNLWLRHACDSPSIRTPKELSLSPSLPPPSPPSSDPLSQTPVVKKKTQVSFHQGLFVLKKIFVGFNAWEKWIRERKWNVRTLSFFNKTELNQLLSCSIKSEIRFCDFLIFNIPWWSTFILSTRYFSFSPSGRPLHLFKIQFYLDALLFSITSIPYFYTENSILRSFKEISWFQFILIYTNRKM